MPFRILVKFSAPPMTHESTIVLFGLMDWELWYHSMKIVQEAKLIGRHNSSIKLHLVIYQV